MTSFTAIRRRCVRLDTVNVRNRLIIQFNTGSYVNISVAECANGRWYSAMRLNGKVGLLSAACLNVYWTSRWRARRGDMDARTQTNWKRTRAHRHKARQRSPTAAAHGRHQRTPTTPERTAPTGASDPGPRHVPAQPKAAASPAVRRRRTIPSQPLCFPERTPAKGKRGGEKREQGHRKPKKNAAAKASTTNYRAHLTRPRRRAGPRARREPDPRGRAGPLSP